VTGEGTGVKALAAGQGRRLRLGMSPDLQHRSVRFVLVPPPSGLHEDGGGQGVQAGQGEACHGRQAALAEPGPECRPRKGAYVGCDHLFSRHHMPGLSSWSHLYSLSPRMGYGTLTTMLVHPKVKRLLAWRRQAQCTVSHESHRVTHDPQ
jgi:hypothetical protein